MERPALVAAQFATTVGAVSTELPPGTPTLPEETASASAQALSLSLPFYGNYCGPGHGDPTGCTPADDQVDGACCKHDQCYAELGGHDCRCDKRLIANVTAAAAVEAANGNVDAAAAGTAIAGIFAIKPCVCTRISTPVGDVPVWVPNPNLCPRF